MKIYTKTGDDGTTGLQGGSRISKSNPRIIAYGAVDEINSSLGIVLSNILDNDISELLTKIQNDLFVAGSDLSNPDITTKNRITAKMVEYLESKIDQFEKELTPITKFILPGGHPIASQVHFARTVTRRAETKVIVLSEKENVNAECKKYLNRLSDLLFVLARIINKRNGITDVFWKQ
ncbi:MAG: cob(I)yrinic acid a,c-diamide adenosyltransferase, partial [Nitrosopumilales archaeon]|nr:cob(I)yrinic acid a,c-diamide adenosyltransferase [Nitrosopumilales archaeon]